MNILESSFRVPTTNGLKLSENLWKRLTSTVVLDCYKTLTTDRRENVRPFADCDCKGGGSDAIPRVGQHTALQTAAATNPPKLSGLWVIVAQ